MGGKMESELIFKGQRDDEDVILILKQNPWVLAKAGFAILGLGIVVVLVLLKFGASSISSYVLVIFIIIALSVSLYKWFIWWNGMYILSNQRIIKINQKSLFHRLISEAELDRIQDITTEIKGPIQTLLNFGTIHIQTASTEIMIDLTSVTNPYEVQQKIVKAHKLMKNELPGKLEITDNFEPGQTNK